VGEAPGASFKLADLLARPMPRFKILSPGADDVQRGGRAVVGIAIRQLTTAKAPKSTLDKLLRRAPAIGATHAAYSICDRIGRATEGPPANGAQGKVGRRLEYARARRGSAYGRLGSRYRMRGCIPNNLTHFSLPLTAEPSTNRERTKRVWCKNDPVTVLLMHWT
jgi:hypothetical protein